MDKLNKTLQKLMLPGLKRWILFILIGISVIIFGVFLLMGYHPVLSMKLFLEDMMSDAAEVLPHRVSGIIAIVTGGIFIFWAFLKLISSLLGAYLPNDRESIPDVLYRRRHLARGPKVVVIGGGTGLSTLLKGLKSFTNNITAIVTVGDDGGSSGRLREELGVLPPGDIRNCITALADEEKLVTELFRYRFGAGNGLEGHSFGNLFLTALCSITGGDMLEAVRTASRVLNSCGEVLPATLSNVILIAEMADGRIVRGESQIGHTEGRIKRLYSEPERPDATPEAISAILDAELIVLGPGSLYTSVIPNLLIDGIPEALAASPARKIYICNVVTQRGETDGYSVADHVEALVSHINNPTAANYHYVNAVMVNSEAIDTATHSDIEPIRLDAQDRARLKSLMVRPVTRPVVSETLIGHHEPQKLAREIMMWFKAKRKRSRKVPTTPVPRKEKAMPKRAAAPEKRSVENVTGEKAPNDRSTGEHRKKVQAADLLPSSESHALSDKAK